MEPVTIFQGIEVADPQRQSRQSIPQLSLPLQDVPSTEVASPYSPKKDGGQQFQHPSSTVANLPTPKATEKSRRSWVFIAAIAALVAATIVGSVVGGGIGSALVDCLNDLQSLQNSPFPNSCQCANSSTTSTLTTPTPMTQELTSSTTCLAAFQTTTGGQLVNYKAVASRNVSTLDVDCDSLQKSWQVTSQGEKYSAFCNVGFLAGTNRTDGKGNSVTLAEITTLIAYSLPDCLEACSGNVAESCGSVVFKTNMAANYNANCLLLNSTITHNPGGGTCDECISATRVD
ncbi:hypothetical protein F4802DRAFT_613081 [Xylaria palmicola]|nr:hypothetical protein F4802DRAFT_613081 [Xylaria palmicola]